MGASSSPTEKFSTDAVNLYVGLNALEETWRPTLAIARALASSISLGQ